MRFKLIKDIPIDGTFVNALLLGATYLPNTQIVTSEEGVLTAQDLCIKYPESFEVVDKHGILEAVTANLALNYAYLHKLYGEPNEDFMAEKISEIAQKIISKL